MTVENTGINNNQVEIYEDYNIYGITDTNSSPGNKVQKENDLSSADAVILLKTGTKTVLTIVMIIAFIIGIIVSKPVETINKKVKGRCIK